MGMHIEHDGLMSFGKNMCTQTHTHTQEKKTRQHNSGFNHLVIWKMLGFFSSSFSWKIQHPWLRTPPTVCLINGLAAGSILSSPNIKWQSIYGS